MSYDQLAASVDALAAVNKDLVSQSVEIQKVADAASKIATTQAAIATEASKNAALSATESANAAQQKVDAYRQTISGPAGSTQVGATRVELKDADPGSASFFFATLKLNIFEYAKYLSAADKPDSGNPDGWDWSKAFAQARLTGKQLVLPAGTFRTTEVALAPGTRIEGVGSGEFSGARTIIRSINPGQRLLTTTESVSGSQRDSISLSGLRLISDMCVTLGDPTKLIADGNGTTPYEMRSFVSEVSMSPITPGAGYGYLAAKTFDHVFEKSVVNNFARCVVEIGCDIGNISRNRFYDFSEYGVLQLGASTFGSQSTLANNDILQGKAGSTYIKTTARHVRIFDNYMERTSAVKAKGFIDLSTIDTPTYGPNAVVASPFYTAVVRENRIDGHDNVTDFVYRYEPLGFNVKISDVGTTGGNNVPWLTVVGDGVPLFSTVSTGNANQVRHEFIGSGRRRWSDFRPEALREQDGGVSFNRLSIHNLSQADLRANNAFMHVRLTDHAILLKTTLSGIFNCILPTVTNGTQDVVNSWMRAGVTYNVTVMARTTAGSATLRAYRLVNGSGVGSSVDTPLTNQTQRISFTMTGAADTSKVGVGFSHASGNTSDIEILSVTLKEA